MTQPRLQMQGIRKRFGSTIALDGVDLQVQPGETLALVGENGAGKSTLMKILSGAHPADAGSMQLDGTPYLPTSPHASRDMGVAMIYQELALANLMTVAENIVLGKEVRRFGVTNRKQEREIARDALERVGRPDIPLDKPVIELPPAARQVVEIARAAAGKARVLIMDEPTSSLTAADVRHLFDVIADMKARGVSIIYISHFLEEVAEVADRVTVLRDGRTVGDGLMSDLDEEQIIRLMVGRDIDELFPKVPHQPGEVLLQVDNLCGSPLPRSAGFELRRGEVFGIGGLVGAGRTELLRTVFGLDKVRSGEVRVAQSPENLAARTSPRSRWKAGIGMVSEDRKHEGLALALSIEENLTLSRLSLYSRWGMFSPARRTRAAAKLFDRMGVVRGSEGQAIDTLSGGNQQKVAFARLLHHEADVLVLDEPTRGIDVGSKAQIYGLISEAAGQGKAVLMVSSYLPELFGVCDRIAVMRRGVLSEARPTSEWTEEEMMRYAITETA